MIQCPKCDYVAETDEVFGHHYGAIHTQNYLSHGAVRSATERASGWRFVPTDAMIEAAAKAIAWELLTPKGRAECRWPQGFSEADYRLYRNQAAMALDAALAAAPPHSHGDGK